MLAISILIFQISCSKNASAQTNTSTTVLDKTLISKNVITQISGSTVTDSLGRILPAYVYSTEFYTIKNDGTNLTKINITMPSGFLLMPYGYLSPDGKKIIFTASKISYSNYNYNRGDGRIIYYGDPNTMSIYSASIDGSNLIKIIDTYINNTSQYSLVGTY